jgi:uncharacterized damage-inducible protein DinB
MPEDRDALLSDYRETRAALFAAIEGLSDDALSERSLDGWSVKDHLVHIALWDDVRASEVERISAGHATAWRMSDEQDDRYNEMSYDLRKDLSAEQAKWELATSRKRLLDAIASASDRGLDSSLYGEAGLKSGHEEEHTGWIRRWRSERAR